MRLDKTVELQGGQRRDPGERPNSVRAAAPMGASADIDTLSKMNSIWRNVCLWVESNLRERKAVVLPKFGQFTYKQISMDEGTWGNKTNHVPVFVMNAGFSKQYHISSSKHMQHCSLMGPIRTLTLNTFVIASMCDSTRETVLDCVLALAKKFGEAAGTGQSASLDFGFCRLTSQGRKYNVSWSRDFISSVASIDNQTNHIELKVEQESKERQTGTKLFTDRSMNPNVGTSEEILKRLKAQLHSVPNPEHNKSAAIVRRTRIRPQSAPAQRPYTPMGNPAVEPDFPPATPREGSRPAPPSLAELAATEPAAPMPVGSAARAVRVHRDNTADMTGNSLDSPASRGGAFGPPSSAFDTSHGGSPLVEWSPFPGKSLIYQVNDANANPAAERLRAKRRHRLQRKRDAAESWAVQVSQKEVQRVNETAEDRRRAEEQRQWNEYSYKKDAERREQSKMLEVETGLANESMSKQPPAELLPRKVPMGYLFDGWTEIKAKPPDIQFLKKQMEDRRRFNAEEKRKEQENERRLAQLSSDLNKQSSTALKQAKFQSQAEVARMYEQQIRERENMEIIPGRYDDVEEFNSTSKSGVSPTSQNNTINTIARLKRMRRRECALEHAARITQNAMGHRDQAVRMADHENTVKSAAAPKRAPSALQGYGLPYWRNESSDEEW